MELLPGCLLYHLVIGWNNSLIWAHKQRKLHNINCMMHGFHLLGKYVDWRWSTLLNKLHIEKYM